MAATPVIAGLQPSSVRYSDGPYIRRRFIGTRAAAPGTIDTRRNYASTEPATRQHASTGAALLQLPEPTHAERIRTLMSLVPVAALSTLSRKHPGFPFGSLMPFALDSAGWPIFLISNMAMHTQNLRADPAMQPVRRADGCRW
jgi:Pyridoxamine 5'-phosphate oxidase